MSETLDQTGGDPARPTFITVLCILSFVGTGIGIISSLYYMVAAPSYSFMGNLTIHYAIGLVGNLLCLFGALQMWKLKKMGYYIYIGGHLSVIIMKLTVESKFYDYTTSIGMMNFFVFALMIPIAFVIMYGVNLKAMVK